jgi:Flp pilus assembly protein TadG
MLINRINKLLRRQDGNITLESTIVFPVYLAFLLLLINFIKISIVYCGGRPCCK